MVKGYRRDEHAKRVEHFWQWTTEPKVQECQKCGWQKRGDSRMRRAGTAEWVKVTARPVCGS